jgi:hypothetical protein
MLSDAVVQQWIGTQYETKILYHCKKCNIPFEKIEGDLYAKLNSMQRTDLE